MTCRALSFYVLPRRHRWGRRPYGLATCRCGWRLATQSAAGAQDAAVLHEAGVRLVVRPRGRVRGEGRVRTYRPRHEAHIDVTAMNHPVHGWTWGYALECSCGRVGPRRLTRAEAQADERAHQATVPEITQPEVPDLFSA